MNHDPKFTEKLQAWLNTPSESRNYEDGALMLLQLSNNKIQYNMFSRQLNNPDVRGIIEANLRKYYDYRVNALTHTQVAQMTAQVVGIAQHYNLDKKETKSISRGGKRQDHDKLPADIQKLYDDNLPIMLEMRELHMQLRNLSTENSTCPDSDRYPFLKELIKLDKQYRENWDKYDHYSLSSNSVITVSDDAKIIRAINMSLGKYLKSPTPAIADSITDKYVRLQGFYTELSKKLQDAGIINATK